MYYINAVENGERRDAALDYVERERHRLAVGLQSTRD